MTLSRVIRTYVTMLTAVAALISVMSGCSTPTHTTGGVTDSPATYEEKTEIDIESLRADLKKNLTRLKKTTIDIESLRADLNRLLARHKETAKQHPSTVDLSNHRLVREVKRAPDAEAAIEATEELARWIMEQHVEPHGENRRLFTEAIRSNPHIESPDQVINRLFRFYDGLAKHPKTLSSASFTRFAHRLERMALVAEVTGETWLAELLRDRATDFGRLGQVIPAGISIPRRPSHCR